MCTLLLLVLSFHGSFMEIQLLDLDFSLSCPYMIVMDFLESGLSDKQITNSDQSCSRHQTGTEHKDKGQCQA